MITENNFKKKVSKNLIYYRKMNNLTQSDLAKKLNYSDKAISKWERGENLPDLYILMTIANLYGVTLNDLASDNPSLPKVTKEKIHSLVTFISIGLVWLIATFSFIIINIVAPEIKMAWLAFVYALPISFIILIVFSSLWWGDFLITLAVSAFCWSIPLAICLTILKAWQLFICVIPVQIIILLWFRLRANVRKNKSIKKDELKD